MDTSPALRSHASAAAHQTMNGEITVTDRTNLHLLRDFRFYARKHAMKISANPVSISVVVRAIPAQNALRMKPWLRNETYLRIAASALISALLFALTLAAAPTLHAKLHRDSSAANHECAVTLIAAGKYEHSAAPILLLPPEPAEYVATVAIENSVWVAVPFLGASIFEHAPPALS